MALLGLFIHKNTLILASVKNEKGVFFIKELHQFVLDREAKELYQFLEILSLKQKEVFFVTGCDTKDLLIRSAEFPIKSKHQLWKTLFFELESLLPYPLEDVLSIPVFEKDFYKNKKIKSSFISFFCVHQNAYKDHLALFAQENLFPDWVSAVPQALYRFSTYYTKENEFIAIHMEEEVSHIIVVIEGCLLYAFQIEIGKKQLLIEGSSEQKHLAFLQELDRIFYFIFQKREGNKIKKLFLIKEEKLLIEFKKDLENTSECLFEVIEVKDPEINKLKSFAIPIGLCMDILQEDNKTLQFKNLEGKQSDLRQEGKNPTKLSNILLKKIIKCSLASFALCIFTFGTFHLLLNQKEKQADRELSSIVNHYKHEFSNLEFQDKQHKFFDKLAAVEKSFGKTKKPYQYYLNPQSLSQVLTSFEEIISKESQTYTFQEIEYEVINFPTLDSPLNSYEIKVKLVLKLEEEVNFDSFLKNKNFPNDWSNLTILQNRPYYEVSFFIKSAK